MAMGLVALDKELARRLERIERLEAELFFERIRLAGLKTAKDALLREIVLSNERDEQRG